MVVEPSCPLFASSKHIHCAQHNPSVSKHCKVVPKYVLLSRSRNVDAGVLESFSIFCIVKPPRTVRAQHQFQGKCLLSCEKWMCSQTYRGRQTFVWNLKRRTLQCNFHRADRQKERSITSKQSGIIVVLRIGREMPLPQSVFFSDLKISLTLLSSHRSQHFHRFAHF